MSQTPSHVEECIKDYKYIFRPDLLRGKVAFITGGGTGICFTIAEVFMRHQCDTVICSRRMDKLKESAETLSKATGRRCVPVQMDVRKPESIIKAAESALTEFGRIDYLVNGAAGNFLSPITGLSFNAFKTVMEIDAHGTFNVSKVIYEKYMKDHGGVMINITATIQTRGTTLQAHAGSAKAAIEAMTKHMAVEWGMDGVRVMCVAPGPISDTEGMRRLGGRSITDDYVQSIPIQRMGKREDIGNTVLYVVSDAAQLVTGTVIVADGGEWLTSSNDYNQRKRLLQKKSHL
ncbi:peroxisomal 2,4-dienoyl-CoA reductase-like [Mizuhopecten yessoensis]|uniref:Peroxisomal 2,4-dienoyl-CoA reductase [(3E)-enoyl-CoA-producing] n=1 Tax=Mizuhopecten yessoensis TaxID=6573 RepID=A0A210QSW2_MIZYE|nr:peroxisomal 2,4-dienoyl-CoA reductase-like [Mizuhopecten yessoensis]OWF51833.1 Peroxisomal 2,4-dienoyl-CoA reductase [Mizuhopecten yessoensis]